MFMLLGGNDLRALTAVGCVAAGTWSGLSCSCVSMALDGSYGFHQRRYISENV